MSMDELRREIQEIRARQAAEERETLIGRGRVAQEDVDKDRR